MFVVKIKNGSQEKSMLWLNKKDDDFIQFLPDHFGIEKENIDVWYIKNGWGEKIKAQAFLSDEEQAAGVKINFSIQDSQVFLVKSFLENAEMKHETILELELIKCKNWPYKPGPYDPRLKKTTLIFDESGNFET